MWTLETFKVPVSNGSIGGYDILVCVVVQDKADECRDEMKGSIEWESCTDPANGRSKHQVTYVFGVADS